MKKLIFILSLLFFYSFWVKAQEPRTRILFILDGSGSMEARMENSTRMAVAKKLLTRMVDSLQKVEDLELGLRVYGNTYTRDKRNCEDTKLEVAFSPYNHEAIKEEIDAIRPKGYTLIAYSLQQGAYDFPKNNSTRNVIILITDGIEECNGDPCAVSRALQKQNVILKPFIIGVGLDEEYRQNFDCVGRYFEAKTEASFEEVLGVVIYQALNNTTAQVNLINDFGQPAETDVNMSFYDAKTKILGHNFIHTLNDFGVPDTLYLDPVNLYDIQVHTIPPVLKKNVKITPGQHNIIPIKAGQGELELKVLGITNYNRLIALIKDKQTGELIHFQDFNTKQKYLTGKYDIEILSTPKIVMKNVEVIQNKTTTLQIQQPGKLNLITRFPMVGGIYRIKGGKEEFVASLEETNRQDILLQPGTYQLVVRSTRDKQILKTKKFTFEIESGKVHHINI